MTNLCLRSDLTNPWLFNLRIFVCTKNNKNILAIILIGNREIKRPRICHDFKTANFNSRKFKWGYSNWKKMFQKFSWGSETHTIFYLGGDFGVFGAHPGVARGRKTIHFFLWPWPVTCDRLKFWNGPAWLSKVIIRKPWWRKNKNK